MDTHREGIDAITEGPFDRHVHIPLATRVLRPLAGSSCPPNVAQIAVAGWVVGFTGALAVLLASRPIDWLLPAWLLLAFTISTRLRRLLGARTEAAPAVLLDVLVAAVFWTALSIRAAVASPLTCLLGLVALLGALFQAGLHAQIRRRFLDLVGEPPEAAHGDPPASSPPGIFTFGKALADDLARRLLGPVASGLPPDPTDARRILAGPMRMATLLGPGTHLAIVYLATAAAAFDLDLSFKAAATTIAVGLDVWAVLVVLAWRRADALMQRV